MTTPRTFSGEAITLSTGRHAPDSGAYCLMEAVAYVAGEPHSDHPACVSPVLGALGRALNDGLFRGHLSDLVPYIPRLVGTAQDGHDSWRGYLCADWACRTVAPLALESVGMTDEAASLRALAPVTDSASAQAAAAAARAAEAAAWARAAEAAAEAAAAARAAAEEAAAEAAWAAEAAAAWAAAEEAGIAGDDASAVLRLSALHLLHELISGPPSAVGHGAAGEE